MGGTAASAACQPSLFYACECAMRSDLIAELMTQEDHLRQRVTITGLFPLQFVKSVVHVDLYENRSTRDYTFNKHQMGNLEQEVP